MTKTVSTTAFMDQKMGTAGLRKPTKTAMQDHYVENFIQSSFNILKPQGKTYIVGGDGRYYNDIAMQKFFAMACANGVKKLIIGQNGYLSTPAISNLVIKNKVDGAFTFTSSHNPGGINGDFGIKISSASGGQLPTSVTDQIYAETKSITEYKICDCGQKLDLSKIGSQTYCNMQIEIIDSVKDYVEMMESIFDFAAIKKLFANGFTMKFDAMNAVTGPYAIKIFEDILGAAKGSVINAKPLPDFGGLHPDPNLVYDKELVDIMFGPNAPDFGAANDGDGDRNMILGRHIFVSPSDSLAILTENYHYIPAYQDGINGVAKSAATSSAVMKVAKAMNLPAYETPTGWKYFVNLMDSERITFCGEESFGTASTHIREKDGIWAVLFWLNIIAATGKSVKEICLDFWKKYGRCYYLRYDFEAIPTEVADKLITDMEAGAAQAIMYTDPVDHSTAKCGLAIFPDDDSRIFFRLSGTGTVGATLRIYIEKFDQTNLQDDPFKVLEPLYLQAMETLQITSRTGKQKPDVIT